MHPTRSTTAITAFAAALAALAGSAQAQINVIYTNVAGAPGNTIPGLASGWRPGATSQFDRPFRSSNNEFWVLGGFANEATTSDRIVIRGSGPNRLAHTLIAREGTPAPFDLTYTYSFFETQLGINDTGTVAFINDMLSLTTADEVLVLSDGTTSTAPFREGNAAPGFEAGVLLGANFESAGITNAGEVAAEVQLAGINITTANDTALIVGTVSGSMILARESFAPTSGIGPLGTLQGFDDDQFSISADGQSFLYLGDDNNANPPGDNIVVYNGAVVLREANAVTVGGPVIGTGGLRHGALSMNGQHWLVRGIPATATPDLDWVVNNGQLVAVGLEDITPANLSNESFNDATFADLFFSISINNNGDYVIGGTTDAPDVLRNAVLVINGSRVIAREGDPVDLNEDGDFTNDDAFIATFNNDDAFLSDSLFYYFTADLRNAAGSTIGQAFLVLDAASTEPTCPDCAADYNQDGGVTGDDIAAFFVDFEAGSGCSDTNVDGGITGDDIAAFFIAFEAGGC